MGKLVCLWWYEGGMGKLVCPWFLRSRLDSGLRRNDEPRCRNWIPAFAGMTHFGIRLAENSRDR